MAREEPEVQSRSPLLFASLEHAPELSSESTEELNVKLSLEQLMADFSILQ